MELRPLFADRCSVADALLDIRVARGIDPAIDAVAVNAVERGRFLRASWFEGALPEGASAQTMIASRAGQPVIALPIGPGSAGIRAVPGGYWPFRSFPVAADATDAEWLALLRAWKVRSALGPIWRVGPIYADDPALSALERLGPKAGWFVIRRRIATSFLLDIASQQADGGWPRGSTLRKNRFHEKHLAGHGALDWRFVNGAGWTEQVFDDLAEIEGRSWHAGSTDTKFLSARHRRQWEAMARDPEQAAGMWAAMLYIDGQPAAFSFDIDSGSVKYAIANSYDPAFAKHSPGKCLYYRNLVEAMARGVSTVDWGAGDSGYKSTIGAEAGPQIVDCLVVRGRWLGGLGARVLAPLWARTGQA